jgi:UDPglucose--hexose-1-phosphate uridylyltransferase
MWMMDADFPHRRFNPLTGEWVLVSPHRAKRPWLGQVEKPAMDQLAVYDPNCYLCPGNERSGGVRNPDYDSTFAFDNDFPALQPLSGTEGVTDDSPFFQIAPVAGRCRVVCFSPRHDLTLPELPREQMIRVIETWRNEGSALMAEEGIAYVQVFENKGAMMGCSNPHPHSQIWASSAVPNEPQKEITMMGKYRNQHESCLICDYLAEEIRRGERVVACNRSFAVIVPFWAVWPFETLLISRRHSASLADLSAEEIGDLAEIMQEITTRYDNLFRTSFPYSMGFHQTAKGTAAELFHLHAHFYPPLLRSATVKKFMVGYELLAMPQRDIPAEAAAERLRSQSDIHYKKS